MNIIIPLVGEGSRFTREGYSVTRPLVAVLVEPLILRTIRSLTLNGYDALYIPYRADLDRFQFANHIRYLIEEQTLFRNYKFIPIECTRGAAETVYIALNSVKD